MHYSTQRVIDLFKFGPNDYKSMPSAASSFGHINSAIHSFFAVIPPPFSSSNLTYASSVYFMTKRLDAVIIVQVVFLLYTYIRCNLN